VPHEHRLERERPAFAVGVLGLKKASAIEADPDSRVCLRSQLDHSASIGPSSPQGRALGIGESVPDGERLGSETPDLHVNGAHLDLRGWTTR